jgi:hypothetical protein
MSEVQLQGLLDRTKPSQGDEEAMDMTTINGIRVGKYSIKAIKVGEKVSAQMREEFDQFNSEHVGKYSVFPTKNGAPKIWSNLRINLIPSNFVMNLPRVLNPNHCLQLRRCIIMANQPRVKS